MSQSELEEVIADLQDTKLVVHTLNQLIREPIKDERIVPYLEKLLENKTVVLIQIPYRFAEIRYLAITALARLKTNKSIRIENILKPLDTEEVVDLAIISGINTTGGVAGIIKAIEQLREFNVLPTLTLKVN